MHLQVASTGWRPRAALRLQRRETQVERGSVKSRMAGRYSFSVDGAAISTDNVSPSALAVGHVRSPLTTAPKPIVNLYAITHLDEIL